jgi:hypothetical protein
MLRCKKRYVARVVSHDCAAPETNSGGHDKCINRQFAADLSCSKQMTCNTGHPSARGHDLREAPTEELIDSFVGASSSIQLDEYR